MMMMTTSSPENLLRVKADVEQKLGNKLNWDHWKIFGLLWLKTYPHNHLPSTSSYLGNTEWTVITQPAV